MRFQARGFRPCIFPTNRDNHELVEAMLARYGCVANVRSVDDAVVFDIDLAMLPIGDGPCKEAEILVELERAVSRHSLPPRP